MRIIRLTTYNSEGAGRIHVKFTLCALYLETSLDGSEKVSVTLIESFSVNLI